MPRNDDEENSRGSSEASDNESGQDSEEDSEVSGSSRSSNNGNDDSEGNSGRGTGNDAITAPSSGDDDDDEEVPTAPFAYPAEEPEEGGFQDEDPLLAKPDDEGEADREAEAPANIAHDPMIKPLIIYIVATIIISAILFPILFLVVLPGRNGDSDKGKGNKDKGIDQSTPVPATTPPITPAPTPFEWALDLPDAWKTTIQQQPTSTIAQAYDWVANDPSLKRYSQGQLKQRFALVGLYYGAGGAEWTRQTNWLSYWATECQWEGVICDNSGDAPATSTTAPPAAVNSTAAPTAIANANATATTNSSSGNIFEQEAGKRHYMRRQLQASKAFDMVNFLQLPTNNMKGTIAEELSLLTDLTFLELQENDLMGTVPDLLYDSFDGLLLFNVSHNALQGSLPPTIAKWSTLALLDVSRNQQFTGLLPSELGLLPALNSLDVSHNQFAGALPTELGQLGILRRLSVRGNRFNRTLPDFYGDLINLQYLDAGENQLVGRIPPRLGSLAMLTNVLLDNNNLSGQVPFGQPAQNLQQLDVSMNPLLTGVLPSRLCLVDDLNFTCHPNEDLRMLCGCECSCSAQLTNATQVLPNATEAVTLPDDNSTAPMVTNATAASNSSLRA